MTPRKDRLLLSYSEKSIVPNVPSIFISTSSIASSLDLNSKQALSAAKLLSCDFGDRQDGGVRHFTLYRKRVVLFRDLGNR